MPWHPFTLTIMASGPCGVISMMTSMSRYSSWTSVDLMTLLHLGSTSTAIQCNRGHKHSDGVQAGRLQPSSLAAETDGGKESGLSRFSFLKPRRLLELLEGMCWQLLGTNLLGM